MLDFLAGFLLSEDRVSGAIIGAIFGALGGAVGALVGTALSRIFKNEKVLKYTVLLFAIASFQTPHLIRPYFEKSYADKYQEKAIEGVIQDIEKHRVFSVIFQYHPEARNAFAREMKEIVFKAPSGQVRPLSQAASAKLVAEYFSKHLIAASDEQIHALLNRNHNVLVHFRNSPEMCVAYFLGEPNFRPEDITAEFLQEESEMKANIIESAVNSPSLPPRAGTIDDLFKPIAEAYLKKGYTVENLDKLEQLSQLPPSEGCVIATEFSDVLASLDVKTGAFVFKNFLYLDKQDTPKKPALATSAPK